MAKPIAVVQAKVAYKESTDTPTLGEKERRESLPVSYKAMFGPEAASPQDRQPVGGGRN